jgi:hypothetical protein
LPDLRRPFEWSGVGAAVRHHQDLRGGRVDGCRGGLRILRAKRFQRRQRVDPAVLDAEADRHCGRLERLLDLRAGEARVVREEEACYAGDDG